MCIKVKLIVVCPPIVCKQKVISQADMLEIMNKPSFNTYSPQEDIGLFDLGARNIRIQDNSVRLGAAAGVRGDKLAEMGYGALYVVDSMMPNSMLEAGVYAVGGKLLTEGVGLASKALVSKFPILGKSFSELISTAENTPIAPRLSQDIAVNPLAPKALGLERPIGSSPTQNARLQADIQVAYDSGAKDVRVNQQQVNADGARVGINRPDLQYTDRNGQRIYVEYDTKISTRGVPHEVRILSNDPSGKVIRIEQN